MHVHLRTISKGNYIIVLEKFSKMGRHFLKIFSRVQDTCLKNKQIAEIHNAAIQNAFKKSFNTFP